MPERAVRLITANQVAAWNMAHYRRAARMGQEQLGARLGVSSGAVSDAERSWGGKRVREFDAQELARIALALGVPLIALLLPPDEAPGERLVIGDGDMALPLADYMALVVMPDSDEDGPAMDAYRDRYAATALRYLDTEWAAVAARWARGSQSPAALADVAARLRSRQRSLEAAAAEIGEWADAISGDPDQEEGGQP